MLSRRLQPRFKKKRIATTITAIYYCGLNYIRQRQVLHLPALFRQFDSVGVFLIAFVFFGKDLLQPLCCFSATHLSTDAGLWPMKNSSPQPSHLRIPISCNPSALSRL